MTQSPLKLRFITPQHSPTINVTKEGTPTMKIIIQGFCNKSSRRSIVFARRQTATITFRQLKPFVNESTQKIIAFTHE